MSDRSFARRQRSVRHNNPPRREDASDGVGPAHPAGPADEPDAIDRRVFLEAGLDAGTLAAAAYEAERLRVPLRDVLIASGRLTAARYAETLARVLALPEPVRVKGEHIRIPGGTTREAWRVLKSGAPVLIVPYPAAGLNVQSVPARTLAHLGKALGAARSRLRLLTRQALVDALARSHSGPLLREAIFGLFMRRPDLSARSGLALWQSLAAAGLIGLAAGALAVAPRQTLAFGALLLSVVFLMAIAMRFAAALSPDEAGGGESLPADDTLPVYTVLVPLFREVAILPHLAAGLRSLDYPAAKLDVKIVLESIDEATIDAARRAGFGGNVDFVIVPDSQPRTKPKALNFALQFATGEFAVIYDAEDRPEPDQLRKAVAAFRRLPPEVVCLQARLDYYNAGETWLTRQFTIEYASLFRGLLPFFGRARLPLPLGGTSNHFRIEALRDLGAWDAFNVTEDADLGMRLFREGYRAEMLDSTTGEEAVHNPGVWLRQRTRWLKGWMQTYGVHMREPVALARSLGLRSFIAFQAYFAGIILSALAHPVFYAILAYDIASGRFAQGISGAEDQLLYVLAGINFAGGYAASIMLGAVALARGGHRGLIPDLFLIPLYWLLISAAAYRALWQLVRSPYYWEKTPHGHSANARSASAPVS